MEKPIKYITYRINGNCGNHTPVAVDCSGMTEEKIHDIFFDALSLHGLGNVRANRGGKLRGDIMIISGSEHYVYDWEKISKEHYNKYFNPVNF
jgi:hypothetical protein